MSGVVGAMELCLNKLNGKTKDSEELRHGLIEFVSHDVLHNGFVHYRDCPHEWGDVQSLTEINTIFDRRPNSKRIYNSLTVLYQKNKKVLTGRRGDSLKLDRYYEMGSLLVDCLEFGGFLLKRYPFCESLPVEISGCNKRDQSWLLFLHYFNKPERKTWVNKNVGSSFHTIGDFSFDLLAENSISVIENVITSSMAALEYLKEHISE